MGDTRVAPAADDLTGRLIDARYRVTQLVATGGMARVYRALDLRLDRQVALKIGLAARAGAPGFNRLFQHEAKTVAKLSHPHVVGVFDQGVHDGLPYVVMEFVNGPTLREVLGTKRPPVSWSLRLCRQVLSGVAAAHRIGFVHRDIKPENILLDGGKYAKVADFGLAKAAQPTLVAPGRRSPLLATVAYIPPELVTTGSADARSDVYATGIVLYEMLTGDVPFDGPDPNRVAYMHVDNEVPSPAVLLPQLPPAVSQLVLRATRRSPQDRFADAAAFAAAIDEVIDARRTRPVPRHATPVVRRPERRRPPRPTAAARLLLTTAAILLIGLGGWLLATGIG